MFEKVTMAPSDAIFGLNEAMQRDPRRDKINLGAGVYKNEDGETPVLAAVKEAERRILASEPSKTYLPIDGHRDYDRRVLRLLFGDGHEIVEAGRAVCAQAPGGTGALRVAADFLQAQRPEATVWLSEPTWPNHPQIFDAAGLAQRSYPYFDRAANALDGEAMLAALAQARPGDIVVLHGCCHNPTGVDPSAAQWQRLGELLAERRALPLVDFAYQGFARGVEQDVEWLHALSESVPELLVCSSYSKNFGLYGERVGALTLVASQPEHAGAALSQIKRSIRANYSNPPVHGAAIVAGVLADDELCRGWRRELDGMRRRIRRMRELFAAGLDARGVRLHASGNGFLVEQNGMFSFTGLSPAQVEWLREQSAIYMVSSGRINVAGMTEATMDRLCDAIAAVV